MRHNVFLSAGHFVNDPGAIYKDLKEGYITRQVRDLVIEQLQNYPDMLTVYAVPDELNLVQSITWVNKRATYLDAGFALDIHFNGAQPASGAEAFFYTGNEKSKALAQKLLDQYLKQTKIKNRGVKPDTASRAKRLGWIRDITCWSLLIECAFLQGDYDYLKTPGNLNKIAEGIVDGIFSIFGLSKPSIVEVIVPPHSEGWQTKLTKIINGLDTSAEQIKTFVGDLSKLLQ